MCADSARATRAPICSTVLIDQTLGHVPALLCGRKFRHPVPGASSMLTVGLARASAGLLHLADSGCRLIVRNLRAPSSSPHKCSSVFSVLPNHTSSSQITSNLPRSRLVPVPEPRRFRQNKQVRLGDCCSEALRKGSSGRFIRGTCKRSSSNVVSPADERMVRLQPASNSGFSRVLQFHGSHGRMTFHWRTLHQSSLLACRLHFSEDERQRYLLIRTLQHLDI